MGSASLIGTALLLFAMPFLHEDAAVVTGALLIVEGRVPGSAAAVALAAGIFASDLAIYALGSLAHRIPALRKRLVGERVERLRNSLGSRLVSSVALCHLLPGVLFPTFLACGWFRLSLARFALGSALAAVIYVPVALAIVTWLGEAAFARLGGWAWGLLLAAIVVFALRGSLRQV